MELNNYTTAQFEPKIQDQNKCVRWVGVCLRQRDMSCVCAWTRVGASEHRWIRGRVAIRATAIYDPRIRLGVGARVWKKILTSALIGLGQKWGRLSKMDPFLRSNCGLI